MAGFRVTGASVFSQEVLLEVLGEAGHPLTLAQVQERAERLTKFYNSRGYVVARALVPAQDVRDGVVEVRVVEGHYGQVEIRNATEVSEARIRGMLAGVNEGALIHGPTLERGVLLISDLASVEPKATLQPGRATGLSDLVLEIIQGKALEADLSLDNAGSRFTGRYRLGAGLALNSPANIGDRLTARVVSSGERLLSLRLAYELPLGTSGLRGSPYVSHTSYELGDAFAELDASGRAQAAGAVLTYPLIRSAVFNARALASAEARKLEDRIGALDETNEKSAKVLTLGLGGDARDALLGGAITTFQLMGVNGRLSIDTPALAAADAAGPQTQGSYTKLVANVTRIQGLTGTWRLNVNYTGQRALDNLDSSEKFSPGGLGGVRAYPTGEAAGDDVNLVQAELRYQGWPLLQGQLVPVLFADAARSKLNHEPVAGFTGNNERRLSGYGLGAEWTLPGRAFVRGWYARKLGDEVAIADRDRESRFWMQAGVFL